MVVGAAWDGDGEEGNWGYSPGGSIRVSGLPAMKVVAND